jgi:hypothetical protein
VDRCVHFDDSAAQAECRAGTRRTQGVRLIAEFRALSAADLTFF